MNSGRFESDKIAIVIPTLNPSGKILQLIRDIREMIGCPLIVVNDGSRQECSGIFEQLKKSGLADLTVLEHAVNLGKGRALKTAFNYFLLNYPDGVGVVTCDGDGQHAPEDIRACAESLLRHPAVLTLGVRDFSAENVPFKSRFGNKLTVAVFKSYGLSISDTQTGLRGIPSDTMKMLMNVRGERFEYETEMLISCHDRHVGFVEVPINTVYIDDNAETHFNPIVDSAKIYAVIFRHLSKRLLKFGLSGIVSAGVDISIFYLLFHHAFAGAMHGRLFWSVLISRALSLCVNYSLNLNFVFRRGGESGSFWSARSFAKYLALCVVVMLISYSLTKMGNICFPDQEIVVIKILSDIIAFLVSFYVQQVVVFK